MTKRTPTQLTESAAELVESRSPHNLDSERVILGAIVEDENMLPIVIEAGLKCDDLFLSDHRRVFAAMLALHDKQLPLDAVIVAEQLGNSQSDWALLADMVCGVVVQRNHIVYHVELVRKKSRLRRLQELAEWITIATSELGADPAVIVETTLHRAEVLA